MLQKLANPGYPKRPSSMKNTSFDEKIRENKLNNDDFNADHRYVRRHSFLSESSFSKKAEKEKPRFVKKDWRGTEFELESDLTAKGYSRRKKVRKRINMKI